MVIVKSQEMSILKYLMQTYVAGEHLWLERVSNPGPFADRANTLPLNYQATRSFHQQLFTLNMPRLHV